MSEYTEVEQPFLQQLAAQGWTVIDQGTVFDAVVRRINTTPDGREWVARHTQRSTK